MIKALCGTKSGRLMLVLALTDGNLARLAAGDPIQLALDGDGLTIAPVDVVIFHRRDEAAIVKLFAPLIGDETVIHDTPATTITGPATP